MPEVNISGPAGRIEARYHHNPRPNAPVALILHPHPQFGGTMNNQVVYHLYYAFQRRGFSVLRFNFRGVGRSEGLFDNGPGELADAATALDWMQAYNADAGSCWIAGVSFGAWAAGSGDGACSMTGRRTIAGAVQVSAMPVSRVVARTASGGGGGDQSGTASGWAGFPRRPPPFTPTTT